MSALSTTVPRSSGTPSREMKHLPVPATLIVRNVMFNWSGRLLEWLQTGTACTAPKFFCTPA